MSRLPKFRSFSLRPPLKLHLLPFNPRATALLPLLASAVAVTTIPAVRADSPPPTSVPSTLSSTSDPGAYAAQGVYQDRSGNRHSWLVTAAHALLWDESPWVPAGLTLRLSPGAEIPDAMLDSIKAAGITDLEIESAARMGDLGAAAVQTLVDRLDARGFRYGFDLNGRLMHAGQSYRYGDAFAMGTAAGGFFVTDAPHGVTSALYVARDRSRAVIQMGRVQAENGVLSTPPLQQADSVYFILGRDPDAASTASDVWDGFAGSRDSTLLGLRQVRWGPGLRFFVNPLAGDLAPTGADAYVLPSSHSFHSGFAAWLEEKYSSIDKLSLQWGAAPTSIPDFDGAARLLPDSATSPDIAWDPDANAVISLTAGDQYWRDFSEFRAAAVRHSMDTLAASVRHNLANVPVMYAWTRYNEIYSPPSSRWDGLMFHSETPGERTNRSAAYACAEIASAGRTGLFLMSARSNAVIANNLGNLVDLGCKGFFLRDATSTHGVSSDALALLHAVRSSMSSLAESRAADYANFWPHIIPFPWASQIASVRHFPDGSWWLPSTLTSFSAPVGPDVEAYQLGPKEPAVIWSVHGTQTVHLRLPSSARVIWPAAARLGRGSHGSSSLELRSTPVVLGGVSLQDLFPMETLERAIHEAEELHGSKLLTRDTSDRIQLALGTARKMQGSGVPYDAYVLLNGELNLARRIVLPYVWLEGEKAIRHTFSGIARARQCSGGSYLYLNNESPPPAGQEYAAEWNFTVPIPGEYEMWLGGTPPGEDWASPVAWSLDGVPLPVRSRGPGGSPYSPLFHWCWLGDVNLPLGPHTLKAVVTDRRLQPDDSYLLGIDAIAFSPSDALSKEYIKGNGITRGAVAGLEPPRRKTRRTH